MRRKRKITFGVVLLIASLLIMRIPVSEADAATSASDFQMDGDILVEYRGSEETVSIPSSVKTIQEGAFEGNNNVKRVIIPNSVTSIGKYVFWECNNLDSILLGKGITEIGDYTFANCKGLQSINIPSSVTSIGVEAFSNCVNLTDITIPKEVTNIHETAFNGCTKLSLNNQEEIPESEEIIEYQGNADIEEEQITQSESVDVGTVLGSARVVGNSAVVFIDNTDLHTNQENMESSNDEAPNITIEKGGELPKYVYVDEKIVADQAFYGRSDITNPTMPDIIEEIGQFTFARSAIQKITLPNTTKTIGYGAFYHCDHLTEVVLPDSVEVVEPKAFQYSKWVDDFIKNGTEDYLISGGVLVAYRGSNPTPVIPNEVRIIAADVFANHAEITCVTLPELLTTIGEGAFTNCENLTQIIGGTNLTKIMDRAFAGCPIDTMKISNGVKEIGLGAFDSTAIVVFEGDAIPTTSYENTATRLTNDVYRIPSLQNVSFAVIEETISHDQLVETVLSSRMATFKGIIGSIGSDNQFKCRYTNLTKEQLEQIEKVNQITVFGEKITVVNWDQIEHVREDLPGVIQDGVEVTGKIANVNASLEGESKGYQLNIEHTNQLNELNRAYQRIYHTSLPGNSVVYDINLYDGNTYVPISKLGKQNMVINIPVPVSLKNQDVQVITMDHNGQLERVNSTMSQTEQGDFITIETNHFSPFALYGKGTLYIETTVVDGKAVITNLSRKDVSPDTGDFIHPKWFLGFGLMFVAFAIILSSYKTTSKRTS